jgi:hypothetical protein
LGWSLWQAYPQALEPTIAAFMTTPSHKQTHRDASPGCATHFEHRSIFARSHEMGNQKN